MTKVLPIERAIPASGAWRYEQDNVGRRKFVNLENIALESGENLPNVRIAYETYGSLNSRRDNAILIQHALTGDSHVAGPAERGHPTPGWWDDLVGHGRALDPNKYFIVAPNVLGGCQGSTGPSSLAPDAKPWGSRFPQITLRDQVNAEAAFSDALRIDSWACVIGGSMGGMRALEWASTHPNRLRSLALLASSAYPTAAQIATQTAQIEAIKADPYFRGGDYYDAPDNFGPHRGLGLARKIAFLTYRSEQELEERFGRDLQDNGSGLAVQSYFDYQAQKLARRFDANSYIVLNEAMNSWNLGGLTGRNDFKDALRKIRIPSVVIGVDSDALYPLRLQSEIARYLPNCIGGLRTIQSPYGHDGFLVETQQVDNHLRDAFGLCAPTESGEFSSQVPVCG